MRSIIKRCLVLTSSDQPPFSIPISILILLKSPSFRLQKVSTMSSADDQYEQQNDFTGGNVPGGDATDNDYKSRTGQSHIPVQSDDAPVSDPIDPATADSDETLGTIPPARSACFFVIFSPKEFANVFIAKDDTDAIDQSNIVGGRTRGAKPSGGKYTEPGDEEGLPSEDGTSSTR